jgi:hypothetical protein
VKCDLIYEGTEVQFGSQENFSLFNNILQTGCVVNSVPCLGGLFFETMLLEHKLDAHSFQARMREDIQLQFLGCQVRTVVTISTTLPWIATSLPKVKNERQNENILARFTSVGHEIIRISKLFKTSKSMKPWTKNAQQL